MAAVIAAPASGSGNPVEPGAAELGPAERTPDPGLQGGPDYLDAQLLSQASGQACRNLDLNLCGETWVRQAFHGYGGAFELTLVEGVMGSSMASAAVHRKHGRRGPPAGPAGGAGAGCRWSGRLPRRHRARIPRSRSPAAHRRCGAQQGQQPQAPELLAEVLERMEVPLLGCLPRSEAWPCRAVISAWPRPMNWRPRAATPGLGRLASQHLNLERLIPLLQAPRPGPHPLAHIPVEQGQPLPVALASDAAFHFRYQETSELLEHMGMPVLRWSPLADEAIPADAKGLILPGGFPNSTLPSSAAAHEA